MATDLVRLNVNVGDRESGLGRAAPREIDEFRDAYRVYGVCDIIAVFEAESTEGVKGILEDMVLMLDNVKNTLTMIVF